MIPSRTKTNNLNAVLIQNDTFKLKDFWLKLFEL